MSGEHTLRNGAGLMVLGAVIFLVYAVVFLFRGFGSSGFELGVETLLGAALYNPVWTTSVKTGGDFAIALTGFVLLTVWGAPSLAVFIIGALGGLALSHARL
jgi:hypothetical protein